MKTSRSLHRTQGSVLVFTVLMIAVLAMMLGVAFTFTSQVGYSAQRINVRQQAVAVGDSALEMLFAQFKGAIGSYSVTLGSIAPGRSNIQTYLSTRIPTGAAFPELAPYFPSVGNFATSPLFSATAGGTQTPVFTTYALEPLDAQGKVSASGSCEFVKAYSSTGKTAKAFRYLATVDVQLPSAEGQTVTAHMSRIFEYQVKSFLNYAIFTNGDMEIHNGPAMTITGEVHSNAKIYVGCGGQTTFTQPVDAVDTINVGKSPQDTDHGSSTVTPNGSGWPTTYVNDNKTKPNQSLMVTPLDIPASSIVGSGDNNPNNDSYHEIVETIDPVKGFPLLTYPDPFSPGDTRASATLPFDAAHLETLRFDNVADYLITIDNATNDIRKPATSFTITDSDGNVYATTSQVYQAFINGLTVNGVQLKPVINPNTLTVDGTKDTVNDTTTGYFKDNRESQKDTATNVFVPSIMQVTSVDVAALKAAVDNSAITLPGGAGTGLGIYIKDNRQTKPLINQVSHVTKVSGTNRTIIDSYTVPQTEPAIRLKNGATLPTGGLTIVTPNPVYVQGDYNTGASYDSTGKLTKQPSAATVSTSGWPDTSAWSAMYAANPTAAASAHDPTTLLLSVADPTADPTKTGVDMVDPNSNTTNHYYWQPSAIVADAVNVLSNAWKDTNSGLKTAATATVVNAAFIAGNISTPTTAATIAQTGNPTTAYSGGIENFPRFLESWTNIRFCYVGSMVILFESQQATGVWGKSNVYDAPNRRWAYDTNFLSNGVPLISSGGSGPGGAAGGGSEKTIAGGGSHSFERKQWISRTIQ